MALINKKIEAFEAVDIYHNNDITKLNFEDMLGHWSVVVFYPADFTYVCPTELEDLADNYEEFKKIGCEVYSVSKDTAFVHKAWADASPSIAKIKYPMIGDSAGRLVKAFDVEIPSGEDEGLAYRGTFILNPEGEIKAYEVCDLSIGRDAAELLRKVQASQFVAEHGNQVCPAKWKPGQDTIVPTLDLVGKL